MLGAVASVPVVTVAATAHAQPVRPQALAPAPGEGVPGVLPAEGEGFLFGMYASAVGP